MTATQLIYRALRLCNGGLKRPGRTPSEEELADGLERLNGMLDEWAIQRLTMYFLLRTVTPLTANVQTYTIGLGGDINIVRPAEIDAARLIIDVSASPVTEIFIRVFSDQDWTNIQQKQLTNTLIQGIWFDHGWDTLGGSGIGGFDSGGYDVVAASNVNQGGLIYLWPIPTIGTTSLVIYTKQPLRVFADLTTDYSFPPGYESALQYQLGVRLAPEFGGLKDPNVERLADRLLGRVKVANIRPETIPVDTALRHPQMGVWDWRTGTVRGLN
jgi:hypothetical protein